MKKTKKMMFDAITDNIIEPEFIIAFSDEDELMDSLDPADSTSDLDNKPLVSQEIL